MASPDERAFVTFARGHVRDHIILAHFRNELRTKVNPQTGIAFTEDEIQRATAPGTRFYIEADAIDLLGQANQQRAIYLATQMDPRRANSYFLNEIHGRLWLGPDSKLPATGASGPVRATGTNGTVIPGSSTIGDPAAAVATDPNGKRFQAMESVTITNGQATLTLAGIDTGFVTRLDANTQLRWSANTNPGTDIYATTLAVFDGGFDEETDEEYAERIEQRIRDRPASGNAAHFQAWAQEASSAVAQAYVYACALNAGSTLIAITEKRSPILQSSQLPEGPNARIPSAATLNAVSNYLIAPSSPVVPQRVFSLVTGVRAQRADLVARLSMITGKSGGWADVIPWPTYSSQFPALAIKSVTGGGLTITVETNVSLPNNVASLAAPDQPQLMLWNRELSRWVKLDVASVTDPNPGTTLTRDFTIVLNSQPEMYGDNGVQRSSPTILVGDRLSPYTDRADIIAESIEMYFDSLGPGEVVSSTDPRYARAVRQPRPSQSSPIRAGQALLSYLISGLGGTAADAELTSISRNEPDLPTNVVDGPNLITFGHINIFPL